MSKIFNIYTSLNDIRFEKRVIILGNFDGMHIGHQKLIEKGVKLSQSDSLKSMVFTFYPQIQSLLYNDFKYLMSQNEKYKFLQDREVNEILSIPFNQEIAKLSYDTFIRDVLIDRLNAYHIVVGYNFTFGYKGYGTVQDLQNYFSKTNVHVIQPVRYEGKIVSSTLIRHLLSQGNISLVNKYLGYPFKISGQVIHGQQKGRLIGFPTANIKTESQLLLPKYGVYLGKVSIKKHLKDYLSVISIGRRPTVDNKRDITIEAHLIDFSSDIYNQEITINLLEYMRPIRKYSSMESLKKAIEYDVERALLAQY